MKDKRGFTLIELLVVIAIIGLLSAIVLASLSGARSKGRDAKRIADIDQLRLALQLYYEANSNYPPGNGSVSSTLGTLVTNNDISVLPTDPSPAPDAYGYVALPSGCSSTSCNAYVLGAQLENANSTLNGYTQSQAITVNGQNDNCSSTADLYCVHS